MKPSYLQHLEACSRIAEKRGSEYGSPKDNLEATSSILYLLFDIKLKPSEIAAVFFANKLAREKHYHKLDNQLDAINYLAMYADLKPSENEI